LKNKEKVKGLIQNLLKLRKLKNNLFINLNLVSKRNKVSFFSNIKIDKTH